MQDKISKLSQEITFYGDHDDCPTCKQNIDEDFKCDIIEKKQKVLNETNDGFAQLKEEYEKVESRLVTIQGIIDQINDLQADITSHNSQINALNQLIDSINEDIQSLNVPKQSNAETDKLKELTKELKSNHEEKETLTNDKSVLDVASLILKDSGIKTRIIKQYVPIMNKLVNKYLASMDFFVQFELDENFNETIKSRYRDEFSYASFSEGEKMRIDLALLFTWRAIAKLRNSASTNLLIMDEVFDSSLDTTGTEEFLKILNDLTSDANIFIISHKGDQLMDKFHNTIRFEKVKNFSRIAA